MPTDTIYGIVGSALSKKAVSLIYRIRHRRPNKPMIILIGSLKDLKLFRVETKGIGKILKRFWPGKTSIILPCGDKNFFYLHRGKKSLAFRLPKPLWLRNFLKKTGPLVAPSANPEDLPPAKTIAQAQKYFGRQKIDFYIDGGRRTGKPSKLIQINKEKEIIVLRK